MVDSLNPQQQVWITLPQALRWIMAGEMPTLENREILPSSPTEHKFRADLFDFWIEGHLKLYGLDGYDSRRPWTPLKSSLTYEDDCWEGTDFAWIRPQLIKQANFDSIDWEHGTLGRFFLLDNEDVSHPYFVDLRVRWADLAKLPIGQGLPDIARGTARHASTGIKQNEFQADKEPISAAKPPETAGQGSHAPQGIISGTKEAPAASDGGDVSQVYTTRLLALTDELRLKIALDPETWTRAAIEAECRQIAECQQIAGLSARDVAAIATILLRDSARDRGKTEK